MRKTSLALILLALLSSLFSLSILSNTLTGYQVRQRSYNDWEKRTGERTEEEQPVLLFKVSPVTPQLFWRVWTADRYTGFTWLRTTDEKVLESFPQFQDANATEVFTVEVNNSQREIFLPLPPFNSTLADTSLTPTEDLDVYEDAIGNTYKVIRHEQAKEVPLVYKVSWRDTEVDDRLISHNNISEEILDKYLQLPYIPTEVLRLAKDLENPSYSILDQVLADVQYLRTNFVYDTERSQYLYERITQGSAVSSYIEQGKGICMDAATALAVILRIQEIPSRISIGYKPGRIEGGKLLYYSTEAHALTEVYLPPYGWIQFDATPPLEEKPLVKVLSFKKVSSPGSTLYYQLLITNRRNSTDSFRLLVESKQEWNTEAAPEEIWVEAFQNTDALLKVTIPDDADIGEKDMVTVTITSAKLKVAFSILAIVQVENVLHISTTTTARNVDEAVIRGDTFWVNGTVLTGSDEQVDNVTIFVFLTEGREAKGVVVGKGYSKQGNFEIESIVPFFMEIGDYKVVLISLGTTQYAPSRSDSIIRVRATTKMELGSEEKFLLGYGAIHGRLLWDYGTGFANASISLEITPLATLSEVWKLQTFTFEDGSFRVETRFENSGVYEVKAMFSGNEYVLGSDATHVVELNWGLPAIQILSENVAIRGEVFNITGAVQFEDTGVWGEPITVTFDNQLLATIETGDNGSFTWSFLVDSEEKLGPHFLIVALKKGDVSAIHKLVVKSKTTLTTEFSDVAGGMFLLFSASLYDDHGAPVPGAEIIVENYGLSWKTGENGNLTVLLDTVELWPESLVLTTRFEGSKLYLPVVTEKEVVLEPVISLPFLVPLISPTLVIVGFVCVKHVIRKRRAFRQTTEMEVVEEGTMAEELIYQPQKMQPLKIVLPDIKAQFPNVWGVRDKLRVEIVLGKKVFEKTQKRDVEILIDEEIATSVKLSQQGRAKLSHTFTKKGEHKIQAILPRTSERRPWKTEIKLRVVDYGEEIIKLYNEYLVKLPSYGIQARDEMTAREIESLILRTGDFSSEALSKVTACFEKSEYSNRLATRRDYEIAYLSLKELHLDVE